MTETLLCINYRRVLFGIENWHICHSEQKSLNFLSFCF